jgi:glycogen(starch) synthase
MPPVRILAVGNMYPPHHLGGYELVWRAAMNAARARGHDVRVVTTDFHREGVAASDEPFVRRDLRWYWRDHAWPPMRPDQCLRLERENARTFEGHLDEHRPDVVSWWSMGGMSLSLIEHARGRGLRAVAFVHDDWLIYGPEVDAWMRMFESRSWARRPVQRLTGVATRFDESLVDRWLFVSAATSRRALDAGRGFSDGASSVLHSGIEDVFLHSRPEAPWAWRLLYVGRIDRRKGIGTAVESLASLPGEATLSVVGAGDERELAALQERVRALGLAKRVSFTGPRERSELPGVYAAANAVLFPVEWDEPWGLIPLEAMGIGRPVVATGRGGSGEYLRDGENCLLFPAGDAAALAEKLQTLAHDEALRARLRQGGSATARQHTQAGFAGAAVDALEDAAR